MSLKHVILGFLSSAPMSGYDLKQAFDRSIRHFWPANQSQIYREWLIFKTEWFVEQEIDQRKDRLDRKVYHITDSGQSELHQWLSTPLPNKITEINL
jgi:DNA-binding PadR family transcriptional regulator